MSDGVKLAATYYVPDGAPPRARLARGDALPRPRREQERGTPVGMSLNSLAETQLVPQGYAALTFDARGHGQSEGLVSIDGPREIQDVRELFNWLAAQPGINGQRIGAFGYSYGGGAIWRATAEGVPFAAIEPAIDVDRPLLRAPAPEPRPLGRRARLLAVDRGPGGARARADRERRARRPEPRRRARIRGQRSSRTLLGNITAPTFLMQGRRDFAFDVDQALAAYSRLKAPKRLYLGDFGHAPSPNPAGEARHVLPEARQWFDRYLKGLPNGIDTEPPVEVAPDPWTGRTFSYRALPARKTLRLAFPGRTGDRLDRQGRPHASAQEGEARDVRVSGASCRALEPERLAARRRRPLGSDAAEAGDRRQLRRRAGPARHGAPSRSRSG